MYGNNNDYLYLEVYLYVLSFKRRETILNDAKRVLNDAKRYLCASFLQETAALDLVDIFAKTNKPFTSYLPREFIRMNTVYSISTVSFSDAN